MTKVLVFLMVLMVTDSFAGDDAASGLILFPHQRLFAPKIADPVEVQLSARLRAARQEFAGNIGYSVGLLQLNFGHIPIQLRVEGNTFLVSKMQTPDFPVQSTDYTIGFPVDLRSGGISVRFKWMHISSHLGDDFNRIDDVSTSIAAYGDERLNFSVPQKFSREFMQLFGSVDIAKIRLYSGMSWAYHVAENQTDITKAKPWSLQAGAEWQAPARKNIVYPFVALDLKSREELSWAFEFNVQAGIIVGQSQFRRMRIALEVFDGYSNQGQFLSRKEKDLNLVVAFDF